MPAGGAGSHRLTGLSQLLKLKLQYAVQCCVDQVRIMLPAPVANWAIRQVQAARVASLLDLSADRWAELAGPKTISYPAFLVFARDVVEMLHEGTGWQVEYLKDIWRLDRLPGLTTNAGNPNPRNRPRFDPTTGWTPATDPTEHPQNPQF